MNWAGREQFWLIRQGRTRPFQHHADAEKCVQERKMRSWKKQTEKQGAGWDMRKISGGYKWSLERWPSVLQQRTAQERWGRMEEIWVVLGWEMSRKLEIRFACCLCEYLGSELFHSSTTATILLHTNKYYPTYTFLTQRTLCTPLNKSHSSSCRKSPQFSIIWWGQWSWNYNDWFSFPISVVLGVVHATPGISAFPANGFYTRDGQ